MHWFMLKHCSFEFVRSILAFAHVCFWKYLWICSQSWYEWMHLIIRDRIETERVDWSHNKRIWSCCSQPEYARFSFPAPQFVSLRKRSRIWGLATKRWILWVLKTCSTYCLHSRKLESSKFWEIIWKEWVTKVEFGFVAMDRPQALIPSYSLRERKGRREIKDIIIDSEWKVGYNWLCFSIYRENKCGYT